MDRPPFNINICNDVCRLHQINLLTANILQWRYTPGSVSGFQRSRPQRTEIVCTVHCRKPSIHCSMDRITHPLPNTYRRLCRGPLRNFHTNRARGECTPLQMLLLPLFHRWSQTHNSPLSERVGWTWYSIRGESRTDSALPIRCMRHWTPLFVILGTFTVSIYQI